MEAWTDENDLLYEREGGMSVLELLVAGLVVNPEDDEDHGGMWLSGEKMGLEVDKVVQARKDDKREQDNKDQGGHEQPGFGGPEPGSSHTAQAGSGPPEDEDQDQTRRSTLSLTAHSSLPPTGDLTIHSLPFSLLHEIEWGAHPAYTAPVEDVGRVLWQRRTALSTGSDGSVLTSSTGTGVGSKGSAQTAVSVPSLSWTETTSWMLPDSSSNASLELDEADHGQGRLLLRSHALEKRNMASDPKSSLIARPLSPSIEMIHSDDGVPRSTGHPSQPIYPPSCPAHRYRRHLERQAHLVLVLWPTLRRLPWPHPLPQRLGLSPRAASRRRQGVQPVHLLPPQTPTRRLRSGRSGRSDRKRGVAPEWPAQGGAGIGRARAGRLLVGRVQARRGREHGPDLQGQVRGLGTGGLWR